MGVGQVALPLLSATGKLWLAPERLEEVSHRGSRLWRRRRGSARWLATQSFMLRLMALRVTPRPAALQYGTTFHLRRPKRSS